MSDGSYPNHWRHRWKKTAERLRQVDAEVAKLKADVSHHSEVIAELQAENERLRERIRELELRRTTPHRREPTEDENAEFRKSWTSPKRVEHRAGDPWPVGVIPRDYKRHPAPPYTPPYDGPAVQRRNGRWVLLWHDKATLRRVTADVYRVTWTQYDAEVVARQRFPIEKRKGLR